MTALPEPHLTFAFEARVDIAPSLRLGRSPGEEVWFTPITGGTVAGPRLNGTVLPYGGDWSTTRPDGTTLDARYLLRADDGAVIGILNRGVYRADPQVEARMERREQVGEDEYYYRTSPEFQTDSEAHAWLTSTVFVGMARGGPSDDGVGEQVCIRFFELA